MPTSTAVNVPIVSTMPTASTVKTNGQAEQAVHDSPRTSNLVVEDARHDDIPIAASIATTVFAEQSRPLFTAGPSDAQRAYRTMVFSDFYAGHLAFRQGKRRRPQRFVVARDAKTGRMVGFVYWTVHLPITTSTQDSYKDTDECMPDAYTPHPKVSKPTDFSETAYASFRINSTKCQETFVGQREHCYVRYLCVDPSVQRSGAGRALMQAARRDNPGMPLYLECATTESAKQFYLKMGFDERGLMHFDGCVAPLPCMCLEPSTASLLDSDGDVQRNGTVAQHQ